MVNLDRESGSELKIGEMPTPRYIRRADFDRHIIDWVGMEAYSADGEVKTFFWWRNFRGDLNDQDARHKAAALVARIKVDANIRVAIGIPVNSGSSNPDIGRVKTLNIENEFGVYTEADKRVGFSGRAMSRFKTETQLRRRKPVEFEIELKKALAVLPYPKPSSK